MRVTAGRQKLAQRVLGTDEQDVQQIARRLEGAFDHDLGRVVAAEGVDRHAHHDAGLLGGHRRVDVVRSEDLAQERPIG